MTPDRWMLFALAMIASAVLASYFLNQPAPNTYPDSATYLQGAAGLLRGQIFSVDRLPGYPALLALLGATQGFYGLVLVVQAVMFVVAVTLTYQIVLWTFGRTWIALMAGLAMATDVFAAAYARAILSETLALLVITGMAAACVKFSLRPRSATLWLIAVLATTAALIRPEWTSFPFVFAVYIAVLIWRRRVGWQLLRPGLAALAGCYLLIGGYVAGNAFTNGFVGTTDITNLSLLGKVMQYRMEDEAPSPFASSAVLVGEYERKGKSVWDLVRDYPQFAQDHYALAGSFGRAVILRDPWKFLQMSVDVAVVRSASFDPQFAPYTRDGPLALVVKLAAYVASARYFVLFLVPMTALIWVVVPFVRQRRDSLDALGLVGLIALYGTAITALGGFDEYGRYHLAFLAAAVTLAWGTLALNVQIAWNGFPGWKWVSAAAGALIVAEIVGCEVLPFIPQAGLRLALCVVLLAAQSVVLWLALARGVVALQPLPSALR